MVARTKITIASRDSQLAIWQTHYVKDLLKKAYPHLVCDIVTMKTQGDKILDRPLNEIGGKALFMKELEIAIEQGKADIAVHSLKDVPYELPKDFTLGAFCGRENPQDALVSNHYQHLDALPQKAVVGTSSLRRKAQLLAYRPDLDIRDLRGNVQTRLRKLDEGHYDAIVLAAAGLIRLGLDDRVKQLIPVDTLLPAVGQGILVVEYLQQDDELKTLLTAINHQPSQIMAEAERSFNMRLQGGCHVPIAAFCQLLDTTRLKLMAMVANSGGTRVLKHCIIGHDPIALGIELAEKMIELGAKKILLSN